jgi:metal-responsive CopG/Arc/MetJ family transcriptional regulator
MLKPTTVRVPEDFLRELSNFIKEMDLDKSAYLRDILKKGFEEDKRDRLLVKYQAGELSAAEICKKIGITPWDFFDLLKEKNMSLNVSMEDWLDSGGLE